MAAASHPITPGSYVRRAVTSSLGAKVIMAVSGLLFYGWLILHLLGNLAIFAGAEPMNAYAHFLKSKPELLWAQRVGLFVVVIVHILSGIRLGMMNRKARPQPYASPRTWRQASLASRTMLVTGLVIVAFMVFHLLHFTGGIILPEYYARVPTDPAMQADVFSMVTHSFALPVFALIYVIAMAIIGLHLSHAVWSATQTLGLNGPKWTPVAKSLGFLLGVAIPVLFSLIPLAGLLGILKP